MIQKNRLARRLLRAPVYLYRWHLGWLLGHRFLLLTHTGRRSGLRRHTVLEVLGYRKDGPEAVVMSAFGRDSDWLRNIEADANAEVTVGTRHFAAQHRFLDAEEAVRVMERYEHRNRLLGPVIRAALSWLLGWRYHGTEPERRRLVEQLPLIAFHPHG